MNYKLGQLPPAIKTLKMPLEGWTENTYYVVDVAFNKDNPIHRSILYVGFTHQKQGWEGLRGGYTALMNGTYDGKELPAYCHYLSVVSTITDMWDVS